MLDQPADPRADLDFSFYCLGSILPVADIPAGRMVLAGEGRNLVAGCSIPSAAAPAGSNPDSGSDSGPGLAAGMDLDTRRTQAAEDAGERRRLAVLPVYRPLWAEFDVG